MNKNQGEGGRKIWSKTLATALVAILLVNTSYDIFCDYPRGRPDDCKPDASSGKSDRQGSYGKNRNKI